MAIRYVEHELFQLGDFDAIIDVRSPLEFAEDHVPSAINLPALNDEERALVGTVYKQESVFEARKIGAALVSRNIARHLEGPLSDKPGGFKPLVYCWRGGQRSGAVATVLDQVGFPVSQLVGGYKAYRKRVLSDLQTIAQGVECRVLAGLTGTGKTALLHELRERGEQVVDLEGLANHQGSLLGAPPEGQSVSQKAFESSLWDAFSKLDSTRPVWLEGESAKIGKVFCPKALMQALRGGIRIEVSAPMDQRVKFLRTNYSHWPKQPEVLMERLNWLRKRHGNEEIDRWAELVAQGDWDDFVERVLVAHYDPSYLRAIEQAETPRFEVRVETLDKAGISAAVDTLLSIAMDA